jgi:hypothetical protein
MGVIDTPIAEDDLQQSYLSLEEAMSHRPEPYLDCGFILHRLMPLTDFEIQFQGVDYPHIVALWVHSSGLFEPASGVSEEDLRRY